MERSTPSWPPDVSILLRRQNGCLQDPKLSHLAYCPRCLLPMHPSWYPKHSEKECHEFQLETIRKIHVE